MKHLEIMPILEASEMISVKFSHEDKDLSILPIFRGCVIIGLCPIHFKNKPPENAICLRRLVFVFFPRIFDSQGLKFEL